MNKQVDRSSLKALYKSSSSNFIVPSLMEHVDLTLLISTLAIRTVSSD